MPSDSLGGFSKDSGSGTLSESAVLDFLANRGTGVLSLAGDPPYSLPMSFAVDESTGSLVVQFLSGPDASKDAYVGDGVGASLVTYEWSTPDDWASAVVTGELRAVDVTPERTAAFAEQANSVNLRAFGPDAAELDANWYELRPTSVTGRCGPDWTEGNTFGETR